MDITQLRKRHELKFKNHLMKEQIRSQIKNTLDDKQSRQYERGELFKPIIQEQKEVKQTIDKKQDELIKNMNEKQEKLADAIDNLNDTLTVQGSQMDVSNWLAGQPSTFDEESAYEDPIDEKAVITKYGFDPDLNQLPDLKLVRNKIQILNGKVRNKDIDIARQAYNERIVLSNYLKMVKDKIQTEKTGKGIRKYTHSKRNAYKLSNDDRYGNLLINVPKLMNDMVIEAIQDGEIVYRDKADKSLIDLITKRFDHNKKYSSKAIKIFNNLNTLANMQKHKSSLKSNLHGGSIIYVNPKEMMKRLTLLTGSKRAGNTSIQLKNEIWQTIDYLLKQNMINKTQYDNYVKNHVM